jgi:hypothetical protein
MAAGSSSNILVGVRIKPVDASTPDAFREGRASLSASEAGPAIVYAAPGSEDGGATPRGGPSRVTPLDFVLGQEATQEESYATAARDLVPLVCDGVNVSVIAYGQTSRCAGWGEAAGPPGHWHPACVAARACLFTQSPTPPARPSRPRSGKTHTVQGNPASHAERGIMPRALEDVFARLRALAESEGWEWRVSVSCLEVYNESLYDLLATPDPALAASKDMRTRDRLKAGEVPRQALRFTNLGTHTPILVHDLTTQGVASAGEALDVLLPALASRRTGSTNMNAQSSRSHAVVTLHVSGSRTVVVGADENAAAAAGAGAGSSSSSSAAAGTVTYSRDAVLDIVDLAGSERVRATGASGDTLKEAGQINKSLHTLTKVVQELLQRQQAQGARGGAGGGGSISWRNSTLTQLLQRSLGGNSRTVIIATISPAVVNWPESCNTLLFAAQARSLTTQYTQNETVSTAAAGAGGGAGGSSSGAAVLLSAVERAREAEHSRHVAELTAQLAVMKRALGLAGMTLGGDDGPAGTAGYDADGLVAQLTATASAGDAVMRLACDACEAIDTAASQVGAAAAAACPPCPVDPASLPSSSSSSAAGAAPDLAAAVSALAKEAAASRLAVVQLQGYQLRCEAAEAQLALQQPVVTRYFATGVLDGGGDSASGDARGSKRMRVSIEGASAEVPGSARPVSGAKRRRGGGAAAAATAPESSSSSSSSSTEALSSSALMSSTAAAAPSPSQLEAARAEGVAEGLARASAEFTPTAQALTALVAALAAHVTVVTDHAAAVQDAASQAAQPLLAARKAASAVASTLLAAVGGGAGAGSSSGVSGGDARAFSAVLRAAADALTSERAASAAATASLATALPRLVEQQAKLEELGAAVAALTTENDGLQATLRSAQEVGMEAVAEAARAREEAKKAAAVAAGQPAVGGYRAGGSAPSGPAAAAAHLNRLSSVSGVSSAHSGSADAPAGFEDVNLLDGSVDRAPEDVPAGAVSTAGGDTAHSAASSTGASGRYPPLHRTGSSVTDDACTSISSFSVGSGGTAAVAAAAARVRHQPDSAFAKAFAGVKAPPAAVPPVALSALAAASSAEAAAPAYSVSGASASGHNDSMGSLGSGLSAAGSGAGGAMAYGAAADDDDTGSLRGEDLELISDPITREGDPPVAPPATVAAPAAEPPKPAAKKPAGPGLRALFGLKK